MGLLDFDDEKILKGIVPRGGRRMHDNGIEADERRFSELQNLGRKENSADFADSAFADRAACTKCDANERDQFGKCIHEI